MASAEEYRRLVERLEVSARQSPGLYQFKVASLAAAGFLVLAGVILLAFGLSIGLVVALVAISPVLLVKLAKVIWIPLVLGWVMLRSLWIRFSPPEGYPLGRDEAPQLQAEIERVRRATDAPRLRGIIIDGQMNAAAVSIPRMLGLLGHRHYLVLGLPLMQALNGDQFASVIAHEFGHFGGGHGRFSGWIYHVRTSWFRLLEQLESRRSRLTGAFVRFFAWYAPYFNAYSFVLARAQEYEADATAARVVGKNATAQALIRVRLGAEQLHHEFWPAMERNMNLQPSPPAQVYRDMSAALRRPDGGEPERLRAALAQAPDFNDTHPTLTQRLAALDFAPEPVLPPERSFAEEFLGDLLPQLEVRFSEQWRDSVQVNWEQGHLQYQRDLDRLSTLDALTSRTPAEQAEHARLSEALRPEVDALSLYRDVLRVAPDDAFANFRYGALLLDQADATGIQHLRRAMELDHTCRHAALRVMAHYYRTQTDAAGEQQVRQEFELLLEESRRAMQERKVISAEDSYATHGLDPQTLARLRATLENLGGIGRAWLVRKQLSDQDNGAPHYILLLKWRGFVMDDQAKLQQVVDAADVPGSLLAIVPGGRRDLARRLRSVAGEAVYSRKWW